MSKLSSTSIPDLGAGYVVKFGCNSPTNGAGATVLTIFAGQEIALSYSLRYNEKAVVLNSNLSGKGWGHEERPAGLAFVNGVETALIVTVLPGEFQVKAEVAGHEPWTYDYKHRIPVEKIDRIELDFTNGAENSAEFKDFYVLKAF